MGSYTTEYEPLIVIGVGGLIAAAGLLWAERRGEATGHTNRRRYPALLILVGTLISIGGTYWAGIQEVHFENELYTATAKTAELSAQISAKSDTIASLEQSIAIKSETIAEFNRTIAGYVTGGDSFCYLYPAFEVAGVHSWGFTIVLKGKYPMHGVELNITDLDRIAEARRTASQDQQKSANEVEEAISVLKVGDLNSNTPVVFGTRWISLPPVRPEYKDWADGLVKCCQ